MKKNELCHLLGIEYPVIMGGLARISNAELVSAACNAGCLGVLSPVPPRQSKENPAEYLQKQIRKAKSLTNNPFGVNFPLAYEKMDLRPWVETAQKEEVKVATTSGGDPGRIAPLLKSLGMKVLHVVSTVKQGQKAEVQGCDAVITQGFEAGGIGSRQELTTMVLVPQLVDALKIPVVAGGGIADGRGFAAALALGAQGVQMGTRFLATKECCIDDRYKQALVKAQDTDTMMIRRETVPSRVMINACVKKIIEMEKMGVGDKNIEDFINDSWSPELDIAQRFVGFGQVAGLIHDIPGIKEMIERIIEDAERIMRGLHLSRQEKRRKFKHNPVFSKK